jgi:hypothetical protein
MTGIVLLANGQAGFTPFLGIVLCGVGIGAQIGLQPFFASRYFGLKSIGAISGVMFALFLAGTGVGPFISGVSLCDGAGDRRAAVRSSRLVSILSDARPATFTLG